MRKIYAIAGEIRCHALWRLCGLFMSYSIKDWEAGAEVECEFNHELYTLNLEKFNKINKYMEKVMRDG